jgi:hypothetical protein
MTPESTGSRSPSVAALLRRPAVFVRHEVMTSLGDAGFHDVLPAHLGVFQHPGPDGQRPQELASRTLASKHDQRLRVVPLTGRGRAAHAVIQETAVRLEVEWRRALGDDAYTLLSRALEQLHGLLEPQVPTLR